MKMGLHFVKADMEYIDIIYRWANDETTRQNAFNTNPIPYEDHIKWYTKKLEEENTFFYVCKQDDKNIGQLRVEIEGNEAIISYSVDKNHRGKGFGKKLIHYAEEIIKAYCNQYHKTIKLIGKVKHGNMASQKCFVAEGYDKETLDDYIEFTKIVS